MTNEPKSAVQVLREALQSLLLEYMTTIGSAYCQCDEAEDVTSKAVQALATTSRAATVAKDGGDTVVRVCPERATPKPEASAANQQAGEVHFVQHPTTKPCSEWTEVKADRFQKFIDAGFVTRTLYAAPISEGTGKVDAKTAAIELWNATGEQLQKADDTLRALSSYVGQGLCADTENLDYDEMAARIKEGIDTIIKVESARTPAAPAASNGDALPPLPEPEYDYYEVKGYDEGQMHAYVLADRAARAGTGSAGSIDGREFHELAMDYRGASFSQAHLAYERLVAYIDTRATKVEAAPGNAGEGEA